MQRNPAIVMTVNLPVPQQIHTDIPRLGLILVCVIVLLQDRPIWFGPRYLHWHRTHEKNCAVSACVTQRFLDHCLYACRRPPGQKMGSSVTDGAGVHVLTVATCGSLPFVVGLIKPFASQLHLSLVQDLPNSSPVHVAS